MGSSLNMLPLRRFSYPCGHPFYNCPYVTPAHLQPALTDGYCQSQRMVSKAGRLTTTQTGRKTPESLLLVCKVQMAGHLCAGMYMVRSRCLCQGWGTVGSSTNSPNQWLRGQQPCWGRALHFNPALARAVSWPCLFPVCHSCACSQCVPAVPIPGLSQPCLFPTCPSHAYSQPVPAVPAGTGARQVSSPALGPACPSSPGALGSQLGLPLSLAVLPGSALLALGNLYLRALSPVPWVPSSSG